MGIIARLLGGAKDQINGPAEAEALLEEARGFALTNPQEGLSVLRRFAGGPVEQLIDFGAPMHLRFREVTLAVLNAATNSAVPGPLECEVHTDPMQRDAVAEAAMARQDGQTFIRFPSRWSGHMLTLCAVETLHLMAREPRLGAVFMGEDYAILRNQVLATAIAEWKKTKASDSISRDFNDILRVQLGLLEVPDLASPCGYELFGYRFPESE